MANRSFTNADLRRMADSESAPPVLREVSRQLLSYRESDSTLVSWVRHAESNGQLKNLAMEIEIGLRSDIRTHSIARVA